MGNVPESIVEATRRIGRGCVIGAIALAAVACQSPPPSTATPEKSAPVAVAPPPPPVAVPPPAPAALLEHCTRPIGSLSVAEDEKGALSTALRNARLGSTQPTLRMLALLSNCFIAADAAPGSKARSTADFILVPSLKSPDAVKRDSVAATLSLTDNRSGTPVAAAEGSSTKIDDDGLASLLGGSPGASLGGYMATPIGKMWAAALADSYNQIVRTAISYKPRPGASAPPSPAAETPSSKPAPPRPAKKPAAKPATTTP